MTQLPTYPAYKPSGLPWLEEVPEGWTSLRGKAIFKIIDIRSETGSEELLTVSANDGVVPRRTKTVTMFMAKSYVGHKLCWPGDLVVNSLWAWMQGLGVSKYHGLISSAYSVYRPQNGYENYARYFDYLLRSVVYKWELLTRSKGVWLSRLQLLDSAFMDMPIILPPPAEQLAITRYLDHATRRIDGAIRAKRRLIALLQEQKQAIIHKAVTRGLDPNVKMKDSGVEWLGEVPEGWEVRRLRTIVKRIDQGISPLAEGFLADHNSWAVLKSGCVNRGIFRETEHKKLAKDFEIDPNIVVNIGDVLTSRASGSPSLVGSTAKVECLNYHLILSDKIFRPVFKNFIDIDFIVYAMNSRYYRHQVEQAISGAEGLANNLPLSSLKGFQFVIPPPEEQSRIVHYLKSILRNLDTTISTTEHQIALLREYRTRLIADVVTGKVDVRAAAAGLTEEAEDKLEENAALQTEEEPAEFDQDA
ncbi:MAG: restriction endonuclease subunit S [Saprospiraceae bacterium]|nr:restriction endonuclease subunit S [Saprospiraceae bacterium]